MGLCLFTWWRVNLVWRCNWTEFRWEKEDGVVQLQQRLKCWWRLADKWALCTCFLQDGMRIAHCCCFHCSNCLHFLLYGLHANLTTGSFDPGSQPGALCPDGFWEVSCGVEISVLLLCKQSTTQFERFSSLNLWAVLYSQNWLQTCYSLGAEGSQG